MISNLPEQRGIKMLKSAVHDYLYRIGWIDSDIEEFSNYIEKNLDENGHYSIIKIFSKFHELRTRELPKVEPKKKDKTAQDVRTLKPPIDSRRERLKQNLTNWNEPMDRNSLLFDGFQFVFLPDNAPKGHLEEEESTPLAKTPGRANRITLSKVADDETYDQAFTKPLERIYRQEQRARDLNKENINESLYNRGMLQLDRKEFFRLKELEQRRKEIEEEDANHSFQPQRIAKGLCDCCGKLKCAYREQLFFDNIRENDFERHDAIKGYSETVSRMRKGLMDKYSKEMLYRRMGDANFEHVKKQEIERRKPDYYDNNHLDENPVIINATINLGNGRTVIIPIRKHDDIQLQALNVCRLHGLNDSSSSYLVKVLEEYRDRAMSGDGHSKMWMGATSNSKSQSKTKTANIHKH